MSQMRVAGFTAVLALGVAASGLMAPALAQSGPSGDTVAVEETVSEEVVAEEAGNGAETVETVVETSETVVEEPVPSGNPPADGLPQVSESGKLLSPHAAEAAENARYLRDKVVNEGASWRVTSESWSEEDEKGFQDFVVALGEADCWTMDECLKHPANPYRDTDNPNYEFWADCADFVYGMRAYYAWKNGLPFSYQSGMAYIGDTHYDLRYSYFGNRVTARTDVPATASGVNAYNVMDRVRWQVSTANFRHHAQEEPDDVTFSDFYPPEISREAIKPGTVIYDTKGHVALVYRIDPDGTVHHYSAQPHQTVARATYGRHIDRTKPEISGGFQNWRPITVVGATRNASGTLVGGDIVGTPNAEIEDFSMEQFMGNVPNESGDYRDATFELDGRELDYYYYVRAKMADEDVQIDPVAETRKMMRSFCDDLYSRKLAVEAAIRDGIDRKPHIHELPQNIFGTGGEWETYSTPARDVRTKAAMANMYHELDQYIELEEKGSERIKYDGDNLAEDLLDTYDQEAETCTLTYTASDGREVKLTAADVIDRLFLMSFSPYHCVERRWGATSEEELSSCNESADKEKWYRATQPLRNLTVRTLDVDTYYTADELLEGPWGRWTGKGIKEQPDIDVRAFLVRKMNEPDKPKRKELSADYFLIDTDS